VTAPMDYNKQIEALFNISTTITQSSDLPELMDNVLAKMLETMEIKAAGIFLVDQQTNALVLRARKGASVEFFIRVESMQADGSFSWQTVLSGKPQLVRNVAPEARPALMGVGEEGLRSLAAVPMMSKGKAIGVLCVASSGAREFLEQDVQLFDIIGTHIAMAIENVLLSTRTMENAQVDGLTGLYNRQYLTTEIDRKFAYVTRTKHQTLSLIKIDVDGFKAVNDSLGRQAGDVLLKALARIIRLQIRGYDIAARWGGDEFMLLIPETSSEDALKIGKRIISQVKKDMPVMGDPERVVTISIGIASYPTHANDAAELLEAVDKALSIARRAGGNRTFLATPLASSSESNAAPTGPFHAL
jgi:diguanylate cyclase (GGDEF)-like protein